MGSETCYQKGIVRNFMYFGGLRKWLQGSGIRAVLGTAIGYLFILLIFTYPLILRFSTHIYGHLNDDTVSPYWYSWYAADHLGEFISHPEKLFWTDLMYQPEGYNIHVYIPHLHNNIFMVPFRLLWGSPADGNSFSLLLLLLNGVSVFLLARSLLEDTALAFLSGLLFMINPFSVRAALNVNRTDQALMWFLPLFLMMYLRYQEQGGRGRGIIASLLLVSMGFFYWFYPLFTFILLLLHSGMMYFKKGTLRLRRNLLRLLTVCILAGFLTLPLLYPYLQIALKHGRVQGLAAGNLLPMKTPSASDTPDELSGERPFTWMSPSFFFQEPLVATCLVLLLPLLFLKGKKPWLWIVGAVLYFLLALGNSLWIPGLNITIPLPFGFLYAFVPFFSRVLDTTRFAVFSCFCLALAAGYSVKAVIGKIPSRSRQKLVSWGVIVLVVLIPGLLLVRHPAMLIPLPDFPPELETVIQDGGKVIDIPLLSAETAVEGAYWQIHHGRPRLTGFGVHIGFAHPPEFDRLVEKNTFLSFLSHLGQRKQGTIGQTQSFDKRDLESIKSKGFTLLVHHLRGYGNDGGSGGNISRHHQPLSKTARLARMNVSKLLREHLGKPIESSPALEIYRL